MWNWISYQEQVSRSTKFILVHSVRSVRKGFGEIEIAPELNVTDRGDDMEQEGKGEYEDPSFYSCEATTGLMSGELERRNRSDSCAV
jgi:hypothetical protein